MKWLMAKLTIKPRALRQLEEIVANVIEFTGFEVSGIRFRLCSLAFPWVSCTKRKSDGSQMIE